MSPGSFANKLAEDLRPPRPQAPQFDPGLTYPPAVAPARPQSDTGAVADATTEADSSHQTSNGNVATIAAAEPPPAPETAAIPDERRPSDNEATPVHRALLVGRGLSGSSWVEISFLVWGGLLALGSLLRLFVG